MNEIKRIEEEEEVEKTKAKKKKQTIKILN